MSLNKRVNIAILLAILLSLSIIQVQSTASKKYVSEQIPEEKKLIFEILTPEYDPVRVRIGDLMVEWFAKIGIKLVNKPVEFTTLMDKVYTQHDFHFYIIETAGMFQPWYLSAFHVSWEDYPDGNNPWGLHNDTYDELAELVDKTIDEEERRNLIFQMQQILAENVPFIPLYIRDWMQAYRVELTDVVGMPGGVLNFWTLINMTSRKSPGHGTVAISMMDDVSNLNILMQETWWDYWKDLVLYDTLFKEDVNLELIPWMCKSWSVSEDGLTWVFEIYDNITWHDGTPLTAYDIDFTIWYVKENEVPGWYADVKYIESTEVLSDYKIKIRLSEPFVWFLRRFGTTVILPRHLWKDLSWNTTSPPMIGCGPFKWVRRVEGDFIEFARNENYFKAGYPRVDRLIYKIVTNPDAQYMSLKTNETQMMSWTLPYAVIKEAVEDPNINPAPYPDTYVGLVGINLRDPRLADVKLRRAIAHAIDKETIVNLLMLGWATIMDTYVHPGYKAWCNTEITKYEFDLEKAKAILDAAGYIDVDGDGIREVPGTEVPKPPPPEERPPGIEQYAIPIAVVVIVIVAAIIYYMTKKPT
ncbi:MAG: ABC transporter substrate-binding protein [archaeon GB-1867-035]|nr:ABC transporter substrate-binding protein [Candidatus Culexmicrobium profundum]